MEAVVALHDVADLAVVQGPGALLEGLHHLAAGKDVAVGVGFQAGVLAVLVHEFIELGLQLCRVGDGLELGQQVLGGGPLLVDLLLGQGLLGGLVHGEQEDVLGGQVVVLVGVGPQVLRGGGQVGALPVHAVGHVLVDVGDGAHVLKPFPGQAHALQPGLEDLVAAHLLHLGRKALLEVGLVLVGVGVAPLFPVGGDHIIQDGVLLGGLLHALSGGGAVVEVHVPDALVPLHVAHRGEVGAGLVGVLGQPEEVLLGGDIAAVDGKHHGGTGVAHHFLDGVFRAAAAAEQPGRQGEGHGRPQGAANPILHAISISFGWVWPGRGSRAGGLPQGGRRVTIAPYCTMAGGV